MSTDKMFSVDPREHLRYRQNGNPREKRQSRHTKCQTQYTMDIGITDAAIIRPAMVKLKRTLLYFSFYYFIIIFSYFIFYIFYNFTRCDCSKCHPRRAEFRLPSSGAFAVWRFSHPSLSSSWEERSVLNKYTTVSRF